ncbi:MAG: CHAD domain-containing protein [Halobaculum sp.]
MEYTLQPEETVSAGIERIVDGKVQRALDHIDGEVGPHETVHEVRKRCKEIRAAFRLVRPVLPTYSDENAHYRDAAGLLSDVRDAAAAVETFDDHVRPALQATTESAAGDGGGDRAGHLTLDENRLDEMRETLVERRDRIAAEQELDDRLSTVRVELLEGRERVPHLPIATEGYDAVAGGLRKSYRRARERMAEAYEDPEFERFHEWRKRVKYHRYHCRLLRRVWPDPMRTRRSELKTLSDVIGDENDLAEFRQLVTAEQLFDPTTRETLQTVIEGRRARLHRRGRPLGERLFAERPDHLVDRIGSYWEATHEYDPDA